MKVQLSQSRKKKAQGCGETIQGSGSPPQTHTAWEEKRGKWWVGWGFWGAGRGDAGAFPPASTIFGREHRADISPLPLGERKKVFFFSKLAIWMLTKCKLRVIFPFWTICGTLHSPAGWAKSFHYQQLVQIKLPTACSSYTYIFISGVLQPRCNFYLAEWVSMVHSLFWGVGGTVSCFQTLANSGE